MAKDGLPYVRGVDAWYSGIDGLVVHRIPEDPDTFTVSHRKSGLRIGSSRFSTVQDACEVLAKTFGGNIDFTRSLVEISVDPLFAVVMDAFVRLGNQVPKNMDHVTRVTREGVLRNVDVRKPLGAPPSDVEFDSL